MKPKLADYDLRQMPASFSGLRVETGPVQFGEDHPGVFLRGDAAFAYAQALSQILTTHQNPDAIAGPVCIGLVKLLQSARVG